MGPPGWPGAGTETADEISNGVQPPPGTVFLHFCAHTFTLRSATASSAEKNGDHDDKEQLDPRSAEVDEKLFPIPTTRGTREAGHESTDRKGAKLKRSVPDPPTADRLSHPHNNPPKTPAHELSNKAMAKLMQRDERPPPKHEEKRRELGRMVIGGELSKCFGLPKVSVGYLRMALGEDLPPALQGKLDTDFVQPCLSVLPR